MLIQLTNNCNEGCEHCLQCSHPLESFKEDMLPEVFAKSVGFSRTINSPILVLSGGESTLHPFWYEYCKELNFKYKKDFIIATNGSWIDNDETVYKIIKMSKFEHCLAIQVTSIEKYYKNYSFILSNKSKFESLGSKVVLQLNPPIYMDDLGRARVSQKAQKDIADNRYHMSCMNSCLVFKQVHYLKDVGPTLFSAKQLCKPLVDWKGQIHLSESWLCPIIGTVYDTDRMIWEQGRKFKPCLGCKNSEKFMNSTRSDIVRARNIIFE